MDKQDIAIILEEIGVLLELKGENPFKIRAYQAGMRVLDALREDLGVVVKEKRLQEIPGIGAALAEKIETLYTTGELAFYDKLKASIAPGLIEMLSLAGLGPKKIKVLHEKLGISTIKELEKACKAEKVAKLAGFGAKSEEKILVAIAHREAYGKRHLWWKANAVAEGILEGLKGLTAVKLVEVAGSFRRKLETVGDLDFLVASEKPGSVMDWFTTQEGIESVTAKGETKSSVRLEGGMQVDLRVVPLKQFYFALHHFTGSKDHNVQMRQRALSQGYSLSEWGLKSEGGEQASKEVVVKSEKVLFKKLGLDYIPPELREGDREIACAEKGELPELIEEGDIRGVFHNHTMASDGRNTLEEMVKGAEALGWEYLGISEHSKSSVQASGLDEALLGKQVEVIKALNRSKKYKVHVFTGVECDILKDGKLDFDKDVLEMLDYVVISVHASFTQSEKDMTKRLIRAIEHPCVTMMGHLTGRLLLKREPYAVNIPKVIDAAIANNVIMELNASPKRLDMDWRHWRWAAEKGLLCSINPDAHSVEGLEYYKAGVNSARKGWLTRKEVVNTYELSGVKRFLKN